MPFNSFKTLLFGFAFSPSLRANLYEVSRLASFFNAKLIFVHVGEKTNEKEAQFNSFLEGCPLRPKKVLVYWKNGEPVKTLANACDEYAVDLLLLGALKRENVVRYYLGSIARKLTRNAPCSVLLMLKPSIERSPCKHIVVNGFDSPQTQETVEAAFYVGDALSSEKITLVEEISESRIAVSVDDDRSLRKATLRKEKIDREEKTRVTDIVEKIPLSKTEGLRWETQSIFGSRGYSIGHYARVVRADLLIMNAQEKPRFYHRLFPKDLEHILAELPTDVLIIHSKNNG
ncbi:MAG: nucleotide-binding universal stress UspA family protein [Flavobacteriaceae bacterium]|jgi:nucleotide-binding universal stress UspA family protein|tara:strand:+ start:1317 stop:2180 length:864 start_codon:yes stop_codon:yes gene_type:complete